ncbi:MAG: DNA integrity scanning protein DisA [Corynebacteriales bacterium]|nr:DNA integrity scanning protein DisA [Mycobacteriales bacterium]
MTPTVDQRKGVEQVVTDTGDKLRQTLALVAPGTALRDGLERILRGHTGGLIVFGYDAAVEALCTGGFPLDVEFSSTSVRELAKMDGAIVISTDGQRIVRAGVHLMPDPNIPTEESGTRHRTAERVAKQTGHPVISVSQSMNIIGLYVGGSRYLLHDSGTLLSRANQALATLERYRKRLDEVTTNLSALEIEDLVLVRDVAAVVQRLEMVGRIADEIAGYVVELGSDGRLLALQLEELMAGVDTDRALVARDYLPADGQNSPTTEQVTAALARVDELSATDLIDLALIARTLEYPALGDALDVPATPRGYRLLSKVPRLPPVVVERLVDHFASLQKLLAAGIDELLVVDGVGETRARNVREGLSRLAEVSIAERFG